MALQVITWLWNQPNGRVRFSAHHVNIWAAMIRRHCSLDIDLACVTDLRDGIDPSIRIIEPPRFYQDLKTSRWQGPRPSCYRRISMFSADAADWFGADRFVSMDLDVVIGGNIDHLWDRDDDFIICGPSAKGRRFLYNGSMMMIRVGSRRVVFDSFTPEKADEASRRFVGSDQAWIAYALGNGEKTWTEDDGVVRYSGDRSGPMMFFPGNVKPWQRLDLPFVAENYRDEGGKSGIIMGDNPRVWDDLRAIGQRRFDVIIALPKTARAWPKPVSHVAESIGHARSLAIMAGVSNPIEVGL